MRSFATTAPTARGLVPSPAISLPSRIFTTSAIVIFGFLSVRGTRTLSHKDRVMATLTFRSQQAAALPCGRRTPYQSRSLGESGALRMRAFFSASCSSLRSRALRMSSSASF